MERTQKIIHDFKILWKKMDKKYLRTQSSLLQFFFFKYSRPRSHFKIRDISIMESNKGYMEKIHDLRNPDASMLLKRFA